MTKPMRIDFVSDVSCPWCVIGLGGLEAALARVGDLVDATITLQPFELNPHMPAEGQNIGEHVREKYGATPEQSARNRDHIRARAAEVGVTIATTPESRIYNTFDAHRLLHWAGLEGRQLPLKHLLFEAYFTRGENPGDPEVLVAAAERAGLDPVAARDVLASGRFADDIRALEAQWYEAGVSSVPTVIINETYVISGGHPADAFERALRKIAAEI
ncbi:DsbA family oxidoreductase [Phenylobacterium sp. SCN 70-31]|uniref:DsbA family oxidoreductase n=1 Tax=Phenylobacterium sp. SCN 70-31 TaxID=1660129 RepID=UPI00086F372B|nr:DsbA family oxidoreductase [Phenylobacterium sp. SCN 70-31]ODT89353.1 MAG: disulfide bond formation protein DsbA [Phenylobacterium sp. SCN 70-31]